MLLIPLKLYKHLSSIHCYSTIRESNNSALQYDYEDRKQSAVSDTHSILGEQAQWLLLKN